MISSNGGVIYMNKNTATASALEGKRGGFFGSHPLGDTIRSAYDSFLKLYIKYESEGGAYATEKKIIYKEEIHDSVAKLDKYFKKQFKKKEISKEEAKKRMGAILNAAIKVRFYDTSELEGFLATANNIERQEFLFNNIKFQ